MTRLLPLAFAAAAAVAALATVPAIAAPTARASAVLTLYAGPGSWYQPIGKLAKNEVVSIAECTRHSYWCRVVHNGPTGWVLGSYLIGSAAKIDATPYEPLVDPFRLGLPHHPKP